MRDTIDKENTINCGYEEEFLYVKEIGKENYISLFLLVLVFFLIGRKMGVVNMMNTIMNTAWYLLINVCFYIMAIAVVAGFISKFFSEFGIIALINKLLSKFMKPIYDLPGAASLGILNCYLSDNPSILTLANDDNFRKYFKQYQLPALTNLGTSFGMGLIVTASMISVGVNQGVKGAIVGNIGAIVGSIISVRIMLFFSKKLYGTERNVICNEEILGKESMRQISNGSVGGRFLKTILEGGQVGVDMGMQIIPGVVIICTIVLLLTNGPGSHGLYTGAANEGVGFLPFIGDKLNFILSPLFGFSSSQLIAVPITALGSAGAAVGMVSKLAVEGLITGNDIAVCTAICMCWSGYLSTHVAMMDALNTRELTGKAIFSHTIGGLLAGVIAHYLFMVLL